ncbi:MAG: CoA transferase subunit A, partial [Anaerolineales bacterium]
MNVIQSGIGVLIQPPDIDAFREWNRNKTKALVDKRMSEAEAVSRFVHDGDYIGTELYGTVRCPMSLVREIIRQKKRNLRLAGQGVMELDMLLAAHTVSAVDITYIGLEVYGISNSLRREIESGAITSFADWSNASIAWRFKAAAMGVPFIPVRSSLGSDTLKYSAAKVVEDPFTGKPIALLPALI